MSECNALRFAAELAPLFQAGGVGSVHSVFDRVLNLQMGGRLITLLQKGHGLLPGGVELDCLPTFTAGSLEAGQVVNIAATHIHIPAADFLVNLTGAQPVSLCAQTVLQDLQLPEDMEERLTALAAVACRKSGGEGLSPLLCRAEGDKIPPLAPNVWSGFIAPRVDQLLSLISSADWWRREPAEDWRRQLADTGARLAGCGPGLTPSSDDLLTGIFAALWALAAAGVRQVGRVHTACLALAEGAMPKTGYISGQFIARSAEGLFAEDVSRLLRTLLGGGSVPQLCDAALEVAEFGSTSGTDILTGIYFGVAAAAQNQQ